MQCADDKWPKSVVTLPVTPNVGSRSPGAPIPVEPKAARVTQMVVAIRWFIFMCRFVLEERGRSGVDECEAFNRRRISNPEPSVCERATAESGQVLDLHQIGPVAALRGSRPPQWQRPVTEMRLLANRGRDNIWGKWSSLGKWSRRCPTTRR